MKRMLWMWVICIGLISGSCHDTGDNPQPDQPILVTKTNPTKVYMHYMPWFSNKEFSGLWGIHWRMANKNPETILPNGQRQIASHYYPLIGPYDSADPDLVDYHVLLMKYCGIDGVLIDWYGSHNVLDYGINLKNANALIAGIKKAGLDFGVVYEDFTADEVERRKNIPAVEAAQQDLNYLHQNYFSSDRYIRWGDKPLLLTFGPRFFKTPAEWTEILGISNSKPAFLALWDHTYRTGNENTTGEFSWVDFNTSLEDIERFYQTNNVNTHIGSAYAGFHDFYLQGGWGTSYEIVEHGNGETLSHTLQKAEEYNLPYLQLVTWNDFGEGTMLEPTVEFQYQFLEMLQEFTGVEYQKSDLDTIYTYYVKRKQYKGNTDAQLILDDVSKALNRLDVITAKELLQNL